MRISRRFVGVGAAVLLCPYAGLAVADPTPEPTPVPATMSVDCPTDVVVAAALGRQATSTSLAPRECRYSASGAGVVLFHFETQTLPTLRADAEATSTDLTEVPALGPEAFAVDLGNNWKIHFRVGSEAATLAVPAALQSGAVELALEMRAASTPLAETTPTPSTAADERPGMPGTGN